MKIIMRQNYSQHFVNDVHHCCTTPWEYQNGTLTFRPNGNIGVGVEITGLTKDHLKQLKKAIKGVALK